MFPFKKKKEQKKRGQIDKLVMGAIIGGAIGSVIGIGFAPKKGSDTRKMIGDKTKELIDGMKTNKVNNKSHLDNHSKKIPHE